MAFRIIEISHDAELHIKNGQLEITQGEGISLIPIEDIEQIMTIGPNIQLSTMDLSILSENKVALTTLDQRDILWRVCFTMPASLTEQKSIF